MRKLFLREPLTGEPDEPRLAFLVGVNRVIAGSKPAERKIA
jgi:hypothetical protein